MQWLANIEWINIIIAISVAIIALFQWRTNENARKQNLYDKRWAYYTRAKERFLNELVQTAQGNNKDKIVSHIENYTSSYADEAYFLFGSDIENHVRKTANNILQKAENNLIKDPVESFRQPFEKYLKIK